ncbi:MAG: NUDIX hydrolase [Phycisphaerales bacterium]
MPVEITNTETLHEGAKFDFVRLTAVVRGRAVKREMVRHPGAVVVLPVFDDGDYLFIRNRRIPIGDTLWELCAGTLEADESPADAASRELIEETGYRAESIDRIGGFYSSPGMSDEYLHAFIARGLTEVGQRLERDEEIDAVRVSPARVHDLIARGELQDAKSMLTLLLYERRLEGSTS